MMPTAGCKSVIEVTSHSNAEKLNEWDRIKGSRSIGNTDVLDIATHESRALSNAKNAR